MLKSGTRKRNMAIVLVLAAAAVVAAAVYHVGMKYASDKLMDQVAKQVLTEEEINNLANDPQVQKIIEEHLGPENATARISPAPVEAPGESPHPAPANNANKPESSPHADSNPSSGPPTEQATPEQTKLLFSTKEEAMKFLLSRFSMAELKDFAAKAQGGVTPEEKAEIKSALLSRLSEEEFEALKILGLIELKKQQQQK